MFLIPQQETFLLYGFDCRHPTEAALLPPKSLGPTDVSDYREELVLSLSSARALANKANTKAQSRQKAQYDKRAVSPKLKVGDWVLIYFPEDDTGKLRKLSRPWHGPYRIIDRNDPDISAKKLFFPEDPAIQVHQSRVQKCPSSFPKDFYWYGGKRSKAGRPPKRVLKELVAIETELGQPGIEAEIKQGDIIDDSLISDRTDQRNGGPSRSSNINPESKSSTNFHSESVPFIKQSKQSHRYALRSRGSCDLPTNDNQDARDELIPEGN